MNFLFGSTPKILQKQSTAKITPINQQRISCSRDAIRSNHSMFSKITCSRFHFRFLTDCLHFALPENATEHRVMKLSLPHSSSFCCCPRIPFHQHNTSVQTQMILLFWAHESSPRIGLWIQNVIYDLPEFL